MNINTETREILRNYRAGGGGRLSARAKNPGRLTPAGNAGCSACGAAGPAFRSEGSVWLYAGNRCDIP